MSGATPTVDGLPIDKIVAAHMERLSDPTYPRNSAEMVIATRYWKALKRYPAEVAAAKGPPP